MESFCTHAKNLCKSIEFINKFRLMCTLIHSHRIELEELSYTQGLQCIICHNKFIKNLFLCMGCASIFCFRHHLHPHSLTRKDHLFALNMSTTRMYCTICKQFIYIDKFKREAAKIQQFVIYKCLENQNDVPRRDIGTLTLPITNGITKLNGDLKSLKHKYVSIIKGGISSVSKNQTDSLHSEFWYPNTYKERLLITLESTSDKGHNVYSGVRGMYNTGNACYVSSIIQIFIHTPTLRDFFLSGAHSCSRRFKKGHNVKRCIFCIFKKIYSEFYNCGASSIVAENLQFKLMEIGMVGMQDCHEFYSYATHMLHEHKVNEKLNDEIDYIEKMPMEKLHCKCIIDLTFGGVQLSTLTCIQCGDQSTKEDPFLEIPLVIPKHEKNTNITLERCLKLYTHPEDLEGSGRRCEKCNGLCQKQLLLKQLPQVLVLQIKRFNYEKNTRLGMKVHDAVIFDQELDLTPYTHNSETETKNGTAKYVLYGVIVHLGANMYDGHYIAFIKHQMGDWFECNDSQIYKVKDADVLATQAYLLFYKKSTFDLTLNKFNKNPETMDSSNDNTK